jgi:hypothetical protein
MVLPAYSVCVCVCVVQSLWRRSFAKIQTPSLDELLANDSRDLRRKDGGGWLAGTLA